jgi:hypothetical protein
MDVFDIGIEPGWALVGFITPMGLGRQIIIKILFSLK